MSDDAYYDRVLRPHIDHNITVEQRAGGLMLYCIRCDADLLETTDPSPEGAGQATPKEHTTTIFECRCCGNGTQGKTDGSFDSPGWARIACIDGPNAICPECRTDPEALDGLRADGYENARVVETPLTEE